MAAKKDFVQRALSIVEQVTGDGPLIDTPEKAAGRAAHPVKKSAVAASSGRLGGLKGGSARAAKLSDERRTEIAKNAAAARWAKKL